MAIRDSISNTSGSADSSAAYITRQQYQDYIDRYVPLEDTLIDRIGNQEYQREQVGNAVQSSGMAYQSGMKTARRDLSRYGVNMNPTETTSFERKAKMGETLSKISAANTTRQELEQQDINMAFGMSNYGRNALASANTLIGNAASAESTRNATNSAISAQNKKANQQAIASVAAMALMFM
jgi:hypothetical protein